ncbi:hypothetical protein B0H10DRAFT_1956683 [Mycena sp. CBHHK59/15]|nr:hypothetical protein B0H10DRAFT_1956683 [Mycena sp. CBHHK59/15]
MTSQAEDPFEFLIPSSEAGSDHEVNPSQHKEEERTRRRREERRFAAARAPVVAEAQDDSVTESESEEESPVLASILCRSGRVRPDVELSCRRIIEPVQVAGIVVIGRGREVQMAWIAWAKVASHRTSPRAEKYDALIIRSLHELVHIFSLWGNTTLYFGIGCPVVPSFPPIQFSKNFIHGKKTSEKIEKSWRQDPDHWCGLRMDLDPSSQAPNPSRPRKNRNYRATLNPNPTIPGPPVQQSSLDLDLDRNVGSIGADCGAGKSKVRDEWERQREQGSGRLAVRQSNEEVSNGGFA